MPNQSELIQMFPPELRTASVVPRWSVLWTLTRDTIANHSFYVAIYARSIARLIKWRSSNYAMLIYLALTHDLDETITGDIVSPIKSEIVDRDRYDALVARKMRERLPDIEAELSVWANTTGRGASFGHVGAEQQYDEAWKIIAVADRLDALLFLIGEQRMGNGVIAPRIPDAQNRLHAAFMELPKVKQELEALWQCVMLPVIREHGDTGGNGV